MTLPEENNVSILDISGFSEISEIQCDELDETSKSIEFDIGTDLIFEDLCLDSITNIDSSELNLSIEFENFIESIGDMMSKSQYILYNLTGEKLYLNKEDVVYESDDKGNRQYYLISNDTPLFQNLELVKKYILNISSD